MSTMEKVCQVILKMKKKNITAEKLTAGARFKEDLDFDSQDEVELLVLAEEAFNTRMEMDNLRDLKTIADAVAYLDKKTAK